MVLLSESSQGLEIPQNKTRSCQGLLIVACHICAVFWLAFNFVWPVSATNVSTPFGTSYQVNISANGENIPGDAANEPSLCIDPTNPEHIAVGWRQFNSTNSDFRQAGWAYSTNGGVNWTFGGTLETNVFRSDPALAADAEGRFYYLSLQPSPYRCDLWRSSDGGASWQPLGPAVGGDKSWLTIDTTSGPGHGNIYQAWDYASAFSDRYFSLSYDTGSSWIDPIGIPQLPYWGTLDVGPNGELYLAGWDGSTFWVNRSTNAPNRIAVFAFDLTVAVDLGGSLLYFLGSGPNPGGLMGQVWTAVDRSTGQTRGNVYALCSTGTANNLCDVMFARSTDGGQTWSPPVRLNTDPGAANSWHWFGTLAVAPNGRIDVCWNDTRNDPNNVLSELFYTYSLDGGLSWATNRAVSPSFNSLLGWPMQNKIGDYMQIVSLDDAACIAYSATFNQEQDVYFLRIDQPLTLQISQAAGQALLSWNAVVGRSYCLQYKSSLTAPWPVGTNQICLVATNTLMTVPDEVVAGNSQRYYRLAREP
jgi:hypothetical protein